MSLSNSELIQIIAWPVTFLLGIAATLITQRIGRKNKNIRWSLVNESNLLSNDALEEISAGFGVPVKVQVGGIEQNDLTTIRVKLANTGNVEVEHITLHFRFGQDSKVHVGRYLGELGEYRKALNLEKSGNSAALEIQHINSKQNFEVEFLVTNYQSGDFAVDLAAPGVSLQRTDIATLEASKGIFKSLAIGAIGVRYDPTATQTALLVEEVRRLRQMLSKNTKG